MTKKKTKQATVQYPKAGESWRSIRGGEWLIEQVLLGGEDDDPVVVATNKTTGLQRDFSPYYIVKNWIRIDATAPNPPEVTKP